MDNGKTRGTHAAFDKALRLVLALSLVGMMAFPGGVEPVRALANEAATTSQPAASDKGAAQSASPSDKQNEAQSEAQSAAQSGNKATATEKGSQQPQSTDATQHALPTASAQGTLAAGPLRAPSNAADDYVLTKADGTSTPYGDFSQAVVDAVAATTSGDATLTIKAENTTLTDANTLSLGIAAGRTLTIKGADGAAATISRGANGPSLFTVNSGTLRIEGLTINGGKNNYSSTTSGGLFDVKAGASLVLAGGSVLQNSKTDGEESKGGAVMLEDGAEGSYASLKMEGTAAGLNCESGFGGFVFQGDWARIAATDNSRMEGNVATSQGGAIGHPAAMDQSVGHGTVVLSGNFKGSNNKSKTRGSFFNGAANTTIVLAGNTTITDNRQEETGPFPRAGAAINPCGGTVLVRDSPTVQNNKGAANEYDANVCNIITSSYTVSGGGTMPAAKLYVVGNLTGGAIGVYADSSDTAKPNGAFAQAASTGVSDLSDPAYPGSIALVAASTYSGYNKAFSNDKDGKGAGTGPSAPDSTNYTYLHAYETAGASGDIKWQDDRKATTGLAKDGAVAKVVDAKGSAHPFVTLADAIACAGTLPDAARPNAGEKIYVQLLQDLAMGAQQAVNITVPNTVTLSTAAKDATDGYPYTGDGNTATIKRSATYGSMFRLNGGTLRMESVTIDGQAGLGGLGGSYASSEDGGLVYVTSDAGLELGAGAVLQNSRLQGSQYNQGGAIVLSKYGADKSTEYQDKHATLKMEDGSAIRWSEAGLGGAIGHWGRSIITATGGTIEHCSATDANRGGGAIFLGATENAKATFEGSFTARNNTSKVKGSFYFGSSSAGCELTIKDGARIEDNNCTAASGADGGAVYVDATAVNLSGTPVIANNTDKDNKAANLVTGTPANIHVAGNLGTGANIGVYGTGTNASSENDFAKADVAMDGPSYVALKNDVHPDLSAAASGNVGYVKWVDAAFKVLSKDGQTATPFSTLKSALEYAKTNAAALATDDAKQIRIQALRAEFAPAAETQTVDIPQYTVVLSTAAADAGDGYPFQGDAGKAAAIKRGSTYGSMFKLANGTKLRLENITIDGQAGLGGLGGANLRSTVDGGLVRVEPGATLVLGSGGVLQNSRLKDGKGTGYYNQGGAVSLLDNSASATLFAALEMETGSAIRWCEALNGGAVAEWSYSSLTATGGVIEHCSATDASRGGGALFLGSVTGVRTTLGGGFAATGNTSAGPGAFYFGAQKSGTTLTIGDAIITGNTSGTSSETKYGRSAITAMSSVINLSGKPVINGNYNTNGSADDLCTTDPSKIHVTGALKPGANIGIYGMGSDNYKAGKDFAVVDAGVVDPGYGYFKNNRDRNLWGAQSTNDAKNVMWLSASGAKVKVITDAGPRPFTTLAEAFTYVNTITSDADGIIPVQMLVSDYYETTTEQVSIPNNYKVVLSKASKDDASCPYLDGDAPATIKRDSSYGSMFKLSGGTLRVENITIDGQSGRGFTSSEDGGLFSVAAGATLIAGEGSVLQNSKSTGRGGAVFLAAGDAGSYATMIMEGDEGGQGSLGQNCQSTVGGGFVFQGAFSRFEARGKSTLTGNIARNDTTRGNTPGGAIRVGASCKTILMDGFEGSDNESDANGGFYHGAAGATITLGGKAKVVNNHGVMYGGLTNVGDYHGGGIFLTGDNNNVLNLSGSPTVRGNTRGAIGSTIPADVCFDAKSGSSALGSIHVVGSLTTQGEDGWVGVWANGATNERVKDGGVFATAYDKTSDQAGAQAVSSSTYTGYTKVFHNNVNTGYSAYEKVGANDIEWRSEDPLCKVVDKDKGVHLFTKIKDAVDCIGALSAAGKLDGNAGVPIKMLRDYAPAAQVVANITVSNPIVLTTAGKNLLEEDGYIYTGTGEKATITRGSGIGNKSMFALAPSGTLTTGAVLRLENIVLDGAGIGTATQGGMFFVTAGAKLHVSTGSVMQNGYSSAGSQQNTQGGGGVYLNGGDATKRAELLLDGGAQVVGCKSNADAAFVWQGLYSRATVTGGVVIRNCTSGEDGGVFYLTSGGDAASYPELILRGTVTVKDCQAHWGGFAFTRGNKANILLNGDAGENEGILIQGCKATTDGGGAVFLEGGNATNYSTLTMKGKVTVRDCEAKNGGFACTRSNGHARIDASDPNGQVTLENNKATSGNGGAIYNYNGSNVMVSLGGNFVATGNSATGSGGFYYNSGANSILTVGGDFVASGNSAAKGSFYYSGAAATCTLGGNAKIVNNTTSGSSSGAIDLSVSNNSFLQLKDAPTVKDNAGNNIFDSAGRTSSIRRIRVIGNLTGDKDSLGVYETSSNSAGNNFATAYKPDGSAAVDSSSYCGYYRVFHNDYANNGHLRAYENGDNIKWESGDPLCKIKERDGVHVFTSITDASTCAGKLPGADSTAFPGEKKIDDGADIKIQMLKDCDLTKQQTVTGTPSNTIVLTTAGTDLLAEDGYPYVSGAEATRATIKRGASNNNSVLMLNAPSTAVARDTLRLENICFDGGASDGKSCNGTGGIFTVRASGKLHMSTGSIMRNSKASDTGGAVNMLGGSGADAANRTELTVDGGAEISGCTASNGGAVSTNTNTLVMLTGGAVLKNNTASGNGGAIYLSQGSSYLQLAGNVTVKDNAKADGTANNVWTKENSRIRVVGDLDASSEVGVYSDNTYGPDQDFAVAWDAAAATPAAVPSSTYTGYSALKNDRATAFYGWEDYGTNYIMWLDPTFKVIDKDQKAYPFSTLGKAFGFTNSLVTDGKADTTIPVQALKKECVMTGQVEATLPAARNADGENTYTVLLGKAGHNDAEFPFEGEDTDTAYLKRGGNYGSMFNLKSGTLKLQNVTIDGQGGVDPGAGMTGAYTASGSGGLFTVAVGAYLIAGQDSALQNSKSSDFGGGVNLEVGKAATNDERARMRMEGNAKGQYCTTTGLYAGFVDMWSYSRFEATDDTQLYKNSATTGAASGGAIWMGGGYGSFSSNCEVLLSGNFVGSYNESADNASFMALAPDNNLLRLSGHAKIEHNVNGKDIDNYGRYAAIFACTSMGANNAKVEIEGSPRVENNTASNGNARDLSVGNGIPLHVIGTLNNDAKIYVYCDDNSKSAGKDFAATYKYNDATKKYDIQTNCLDYSGYYNAFVNENETVTGHESLRAYENYTTPATAAGGTVYPYIKWGNVDPIAKTIDKNGGAHPFATLKDAFGCASAVGATKAADGDSSDIPVQMLVESYEMKNTGGVDDTNVSLALPTANTVVFSTAAVNATDGLPYRGASGTKATIKRAYANGSLFSLTQGLLALKDVTIDGNYVGGNLSGGDGSLFKVSNGATLTLSEGSVLKNARASGNYGGAIYLADGLMDTPAKLVMDGTKDNPTQAFDCEGGWGGFVIARGGSLVDMKGYSSIKNCTARNSGGGVYLDSDNASETQYARLNMSGHASIEGCKATSGGALRMERWARLSATDDSKMLGNEATNNYGGGIDIENANQGGWQIALTGNFEASGNKAKSDGGFIYGSSDASTGITLGDQASIHDNTVEANNAAAGGITLLAGTKLNVSGSPTVRDNTNGAGKTANVVTPSKTQIIVTGDLTGGEIGVYGTGTGANKNSGANDQFGTVAAAYKSDAKSAVGLSTFKNDLTDGLMGKPGDADAVVWGYNTVPVSFLVRLDKAPAEDLWFFVEAKGTDATTGTATGDLVRIPFKVAAGSTEATARTVMLSPSQKWLVREVASHDKWLYAPDDVVSEGQAGDAGEKDAVVVDTDKVGALTLDAGAKTHKVVLKAKDAGINYDRAVPYVTNNMAS